jgi:hypothetical protein
MSTDNSDSKARPRRSTLETFSEELAVLDRPLEGDVEYYDEVPPTRRLRLLPVAVAVFAAAGGGLWALSAHRGKRPIEVGAVATSIPPASVPAFTPPPPSPPAVALSGTTAAPIAAAPSAPAATAPLATPPAATAPPTESPEENDEVPARTSSPASTAVWAKSFHPAGQPKHGRSADKRSSGRSVRRHG